MGYACPVCEDPQADAEHLANHLAFTAMLGDDDHEAWLDEHVPDWADMGPSELADRATDHADEREYPQVFEDTTGDGESGGYHEGHRQGHGHDHGHGGNGPGQGGHGYGSHGGSGRAAGRGPGASGLGGVGVDDADEYDTEADPDDVMAEARELTRRMRETDGESGDDVVDASESGDTDGDGTSDGGAEPGGAGASDEAAESESSSESDSGGE